MTPISKIKRRQLQLPMLLGVGVLVLGIGGSILRDRMLTTKESADTKAIPMDALPVNETRTSEFIQPLASVIDDETASKLARRADPRMMSYMRDRPDLSGAGSTPTGKSELFFGNLDRASLDDHEHRHSLLEHPGLTISYSGQNRTANVQRRGNDDDGSHIGQQVPHDDGGRWNPHVLGCPNKVTLTQAERHAPHHARRDHPVKNGEANHQQQP